MSPDQDVLLGATDNSVYSKKSSDVKYGKVKITNKNGITNEDLIGTLPRFYSGAPPKGEPTWPQTLNISLIEANLEADGCKFTAAIGFNGNLRGDSVSRVYYPIYPVKTCIDFTVYNYGIYSDPVLGIEDGFIAITAKDSLTGQVFFYSVVGGTSNVLSSWIDDSAVVYADVNGFYLYTKGTCA